MEQSLARRIFGDNDQIAFAKLSGDWNPMHMDKVAARRTQAGAPVVHGVHMLLWSLDAFAASGRLAQPFTGLKVRFDKMVYVGDLVDAVLTQCDDGEARIELRVNGNPTSLLVASFGQPRPANAFGDSDDQPVFPDRPIELSLEDTETRSGRVGFAATSLAATEAFPAIAALMNAGWVRAVLATTTLVGMVCPGLHSIFGGLTLTTASAQPGVDALAYKVTKTHAKFRVVRMEVAAPGVAGTIESFVRHPPTAQRSIADLAALVAPEEFAGATALVIGGSRGLGELTAKLLAAGGARVIATYAVGSAEAERVTEEIRAWGGHCDFIAYDVTKPARPQLQYLSAAPTHFYYFATPGIFRSKGGLYVAERFAEFRTYYVDAFYDLFMALREGAPDGLAAFYPSSIAVTARPTDMTEYSMAKAAGEVLCADIQAFLPGSRIVINRLPRLPTDQTATLLPTEAADPAAVMLPIVLEVQGKAPR
jgi:hypothetical protein